MSEHSGSRLVLAAVLFDMDGVVTDTAQVHAAAWQRLFDEYLQARADRIGESIRPFDPGHDYLKYVDGKPRNDGVESFLRARGIELPWGEEDDGPDRETICGLGNRKNGYFNAWLAEHQARPYPGTLRLIDDLHAAGIRIAVFSASRNAVAVLRSAGVLDLFDARVDGTDLAKLGLPGKPDPAMLLEAAHRLGVAPADAAIIEDSLAGVEAGARGGFGRVVGVARRPSGDELKRAGADLVVQDLAELRLLPGGDLQLKNLADLPSARDREDAIRRRLEGKVPVVFLDYDGTLTPIVEDHTRALLSSDMHSALAGLARHVPVIIVSGRDLERLRVLVRLDSVFRAGSHGFEIAGPESSGEYLEMGAEFLPELDEVEHLLRDGLAGIEGCTLERKRFSIAVHYRQVAAENLGGIESVLGEILAAHPRLQLGHGKKVFEIRPGIDWHKGRAVLWILERLGLEGDAAVPVYVGDDITDEDAFRALSGRGLCIAVRHDEKRPTAADYAVQNTDEVRWLLELLTDIATGGQAVDGAGS